MSVNIFKPHSRARPPVVNLNIAIIYALMLNIAIDFAAIASDLRCNLLYEPGLI